MESISQETDPTEIITRLIPLGAKIKKTDENGNEVETEERLTIASVNEGKIYLVNEELEEVYGIHYGVQEFGDVTLPENLKTKGMEWMVNNNRIRQKNTISALELSLIGKEYEEFKLYNSYPVKNELLGINGNARVVKKNINVIDPISSTMTFGDKDILQSDLEINREKEYGQIKEVIESIKTDYEINNARIQTQIENIKKTLTVELSSNSTLYQRKLKSGSLDPDYMKTPLVLTPTVKYKGQQVTDNLTFTWKRKIKDAAETALVSGETVSNGILTVKRNLSEGLVRYICYVTYTASETEQKIANAYLDFAQLEDGQNGLPGEPGQKGDPGKDAAIVSSTEPEDKTQLWCDISVDPPVLKRWDGTDWKVVGDQSEAINEIYKNVYSAIEQSSDNVMIKVGEECYLKKEVDQLLSSISTEYSQTKNSFNYKFNQFMQDLESLSSGTDAKFLDISKYIRFIDGNIELGQNGNPLMCRIKNNRISFLENGVEIAYIADRKLYITDGEFINSLRIGSFAFIPRKNGNLSFKKVR